MEEGEPRPRAGAGEPLRFPGGSEARTPLGGRPGGQQPPRFWGLPFPTRRDARREGDGPFQGRKRARAALEVSSGGAALAEFGRRVGALRAGRGQRPATPRGNVFPPPGGALRRRGGGLKLGVQAGAEGVGAEGAQRPEGRRIGIRDEPAPRARLSLTYKTYIYLLGTVFGTGKKPFLVLANEEIGTGKNTFRARPKIGTGPDTGPSCG